MSTVQSNDPIFGRVARELDSAASPSQEDYFVALRAVAGSINPQKHEIESLVKTAAAAGVTRAEVLTQLQKLRARLTQAIIILPHPKCRPPGIDGFDARDVRYLSAMTGDSSDWSRCPYRSIRPVWMSEPLHKSIAAAMPLVTSRQVGAHEALEIAVAEGFPLAETEKSGLPADSFTRFASATVNAVVGAVKAIITPDKFAPLPDEGVTAETIANQSLGRVVMAKIITDCLQEQGRLLRPPRGNDWKPGDAELQGCRRLTFYVAIRGWLN